MRSEIFSNKYVSPKARGLPSVCILVSTQDLWENLALLLLLGEVIKNWCAYVTQESMTRVWQVTSSIQSDNRP